MARGFKSGGRAANTPNKRTVQKMIEASQQVAEIKKLGQRKATQVLNELMHMSLDLVHKYQARVTRAKKPKDDDLQMFKWSTECAGAFAKALAPFQDPTFKAITVTPAAGLSVQTQPGDDAKVVPGKVVKLDDPNEVVRLYQLTMKRIA